MPVAQTSAFSTEDTSYHVTARTTFFSPSWSHPAASGIFYNISNNPCDFLQPCLNNGTCDNTNATKYGYICRCPTYFNGTECQQDHRPCQPDTCWNQGQFISLLNEPTDRLVIVFRNLPYHAEAVISVSVCQWVARRSLRESSESLSKCSMFERWRLSTVVSQLYLSVCRSELFRAVL